MSQILFVMLHPGFVRYYDGALRSLADAGHQVHVAFEVSRSKLGEDETARRLATISPRITCGTTPDRQESVRQFLVRGDRLATRSGDYDRAASWPEARLEAWESLATTVRLLLDYLRYFEPEFAAAVKLRARAEKRLPRIYLPMTRSIARSGRMARRALGGMLRFCERVIPVNPDIEAFVRSHNPDLLFVTPLIELGSQQVDYVKAARRLGVRSVHCVASWDNLTSKGVVRVTPDHAIVWNEAQKQEAVALQGMTAAQVEITGAQVFDRWFSARPSRSREEFCRRTGLDPARPFVLYVCSSMFIAPDEVPFVQRLVSHVRAAASPDVRGAGILIRPHPANARQWHAFDPTSYDNVGLWPPVGTDPNALDFWSDYFDSIFYSQAVIGINTSAQLEAAIVGRPVLTVRTAEFAHAQEGTLHFQHLVGPNGAVQSAASLPEHVSQLAELLVAEGAERSAALQKFVSFFIRPHGLDVSAAAAFTQTTEKLASLAKPHARRDPAIVRALRPPMLALAFGARALAEDRPLWVFLLRPLATAVVWTAALAYRVRRSTTQVLKKVRRASWRTAYESAQVIRKTARRLNKPVAKKVRQARARVAASSAHRKG